MSHEVSWRLILALMFIGAVSIIPTLLTVGRIYHYKEYRRQLRNHNRYMKYLATTDHEHTAKCDHRPPHREHHHGPGPGAVWLLTLVAAVVGLIFSLLIGWPLFHWLGYGVQGWHTATPVDVFCDALVLASGLIYIFNFLFASKKKNLVVGSIALSLLSFVVWTFIFNWQQLH